MKAISMDVQALAAALRLAITAQTERQYKKALVLASTFAQGMTPRKVAQAKRLASGSN